MHSKFTTRSLIIMALFAALLCISAYISIPLPTGHITLQNFLVLLIAFLFPLQQSFLILLIWLLLGAIGVPVFVGGNAGISYLIGPFGGYSITFLIIAVILPLLRSKTYKRTYYTILSIFAVFIIDILGAFWLMFLNNLSVKQAFLIGVLPYLPLDILKAVATAQIVPQFKRIIVSGETEK